MSQKLKNILEFNEGNTAPYDILSWGICVDRRTNHSWYVQISSSEWPMMHTNKIMYSRSFERLTPTTLKKVLIFRRIVNLSKNHLFQQKKTHKNYQKLLKGRRLIPRFHNFDPFGLIFGPCGNYNSFITNMRSLLGYDENLSPRD